MKGFKRIISFSMAFAMACTIFMLPAKADYSTSTTDTLWGSYIRAGVNSVQDVPIIGTMLGYVVGWSSGRVCAASDDQLHHADSYESCVVDKDGTPYVSCICKYCGDRFKAVASDLSAAYDDYVETLPATGYNSSGRLIWQPSIEDITSCSRRASPKFSCPSSSDYGTMHFTLEYNSSFAGVVEHYSLSSGQTSGGEVWGGFDIKFDAPISGRYSLSEFSFPWLSWSVFDSSGLVVSSKEECPGGTWGPLYYSAGSSASYSHGVVKLSENQIYSVDTVRLHIHFRLRQQQNIAKSTKKCVDSAGRFWYDRRAQNRRAGCASMHLSPFRRTRRA